ncbi:MAG: cytochrome c oxidase subunit 3 [Bacteroidia bacterium]|nr:cytochrome c oxidase subunit 3 [Bacteroidia bacterium]
MSTNRKTHTDAKSITDFSRLEKMHPYKTLVFFGLVGSTILFLSMTFLYFVTLSRTQFLPEFHLPKAFSVSTVFLLLSSFSISGILRAYKNDGITEIRNRLAGTLALGVIFCFTQVYGWLKLYESGIFLSSNVGVAYLYVITGMHFLHVVAGLVYIALLTHRVATKKNDVVKSLLYFTDGFQYTRLQLISVYWHFVDVLWVVLFFVFLFSF